MAEVFFEVRDLVHEFFINEGLFGEHRVIRAVDRIDFVVRVGEAVGLVGESGCGKSTLARCIAKLHRPSRGTILFEGHDLTRARGRRLLAFRQRLQMIFQDPYSSLNPRMTIGEIVREPLDIYARWGLIKLDRRQREERVEALLEHVGLHPRLKNRYPHEFSGGQRQRVGIARALALSPRLVVADEPVTALDVSIQAQILNLLRRLRKEDGLALLFIAHDLAVVHAICDRIAVMYLGTLVEEAPAPVLVANPLHPYTQALYSAAPVPDPKVERARRRILLEGDVPSPERGRRGCPFASRCPRRMDVCTAHRPALVEVEEGRRVACFLHHQETMDPS